MALTTVVVGWVVGDLFYAWRWRWVWRVRRWSWGVYIQMTYKCLGEGCIVCILLIYSEV